MSLGTARPASLLALVGTLALGLWLHWPSLDFPFSVDDTLHVAELEGLEPIPPRSGLSLYVFADGEPQPMGPVQGHYLPWWSADDLLVAFHRPLSSLTHTADYMLHGSDPAGFHATNLLLYAALLAAVWLLFRELARDSGRGNGVVWLAGAIFALDSAHIDSVTWIAGRYTLVTVFFCVLSLLQYHRARRDGSRRSAAFAISWLVAALFSSEAAVSLAGWVLAYEVCVSRTPPLERLRAMAPIALTMFAFLVYYKLSGYGTRASAMYVDPAEDPLRFLAYMSNVAPVAIRMALTSSQLTFAMLRIDGASVAVPVAILLVLSPQLWRDRLSAFVLLGAFLGIVPQSASAVREHSLLLASVGVSWVYGAFVADFVRDLVSWVRARAWPGASRAVFAVPRLALTGAIVVVSLWIDPSAARRTLIPETEELARERWRMADQAELPADEAIADSRVLLLTAPDPSMAIYLPIYRLQAGHPWPGAIWPISITSTPHDLTRTGARSFSYTIRTRSGFLHGGFAGMFNDANDYPVGLRFRMGALEVEVLEAFQYGEQPDHRVRTIGVTIDRNLDHESVWLLAWNGDRWARIAPPRKGDTIRLTSRPTSPTPAPRQRVPRRQRPDGEKPSKDSSRRR